MRWKKNARNTAAHEIVSVTDEWLKKMVGYDSRKIMKLLKDFTQMTCSDIKPSIWESYDEMNRLIIKTLTAPVVKE